VLCLKLLDDNDDDDVSTESWGGGDVLVRVSNSTRLAGNHPITRCLPRD